MQNNEIAMLIRWEVEGIISESLNHIIRNREKMVVLAEKFIRSHASISEITQNETLILPCWELTGLSEFTIQAALNRIRSENTSLLENIAIWLIEATNEIPALPSDPRETVIEKIWWIEPTEKWTVITTEGEENYSYVAERSNSKSIQDLVISYGKQGFSCSIDQEAKIIKFTKGLK